MKNGFYQRILLVSKYPKRVGAKILIFFKTLLDGPFDILISIQIFREGPKWLKARDLMSKRVRSNTQKLLKKTKQLLKEV